ncbi:TonB-dependent receptor [Niabella aquatica]
MKLSVFLILFTSFQAIAINGTSQKRINLDLKGESIISILRRLERRYEYRFFYSDDVALDRQKVDMYASNATIDNVMQKLLQNTAYSYKTMSRDLVVIIGHEDKMAKMYPIRGKIVNDKGEPLSGVTVIEKGTTNGTSTREDGSFSLDVKDQDAVLIISTVGYTTLELSVKNDDYTNIIMTAVENKLDEVVVVGYNTQKRASLTGAVSDIKGDEIIRTKNENLQNMLTGRLPGLRVSQRSSEPGSFDMQMDIRAMGTPLIVIDGIPRDMEAFQRLDPNDIDNISILKDATAAVYGVRSANGVVVVTTKRGKAGKSELNYSGSYIFQFPSGLPVTVDAADNMILRNELSMHRLQGQSRLYSDEQINAYLDGTKQSTNWKDAVFKKYGPQSIHNLSATGGSDKIKYYLGAGYQYQNSFFNTDDVNYKKYNVRSTITANITDNLKAELLMNFIMDEQNTSDVDSWWIIRAFWKVGPFFPVYANNDPARLNFNDQNDGDNPVAYINGDITGRRKTKRKWMSPTANLRWDIPFVKGLYVKEQVSYDWTMWDMNHNRREYQVYSYDEASKTYKGVYRNSPSYAERGMITRDQLLSQTSIGYDKKINAHNVSGLLVWETQKRTADNFNASRNLILPVPYLFAGVSEGQQGGMNASDIYEMTGLGLVGAFHYDYEGKYILDYSFRYDGSSKFAPGNQWGFFPSVAGAWRISEENFFKNIFPSVDQLKLRASYGLVGDDAASAYQFVSGYNYPTGGSDRRWFTAGYVFGNSFLASADNKGIPNPNIGWFDSRTFNAGFDFIGWKGLLGITAEYFARKRVGLLAQRNGGIPTVVGAALPQENINSDLTSGFELELSHKNTIGRDLHYGVKGMVSLVRVKRLYVERGAIGSSWNNWKNNQNNRLQGVSWLYNGTGQYQSWDDIWNSKIFVDPGVLPGDYAYEDWNGDGEINENDIHPMRFNQNPWMNFSLNSELAYKGFDFSFLLQGQALSTITYGEKIMNPMWGSGPSGILSEFLDRWRPVDPAADPYSRNTQWINGTYAYMGTNPRGGSTLSTVNGAYLRLKNIELGYSLPATLVKRTGLAGIRIYGSAYNLLTFTKVKFVDPEHTDNLYGYIYPLNKTVSVGLNVRF